jgi:hypothetical protein
MTLGSFAGLQFFHWPKGPSAVQSFCPRSVSHVSISQFFASRAAKGFFLCGHLDSRRKASASYLRVNFPAQVWSIIIQNAFGKLKTAFTIDRLWSLLWNRSERHHRGGFGHMRKAQRMRRFESWRRGQQAFWSAGTDLHCATKQ